jgi:hypothetical protein
VLGILASRVNWRLPQAPLGIQVLVASGTPLVLVGVFLGPMTNVVTRELAGQLAPISALGLGWLGMIFGLQLDRTIVREFRGVLWRFALLQAGIAFLIAALGAVAIRLSVPGLRAAWSPAETAVFTLASVAAISAPTGLSIAARRLKLRRGPLLDLLSFSASVDGLIGVFAFTAVLAVYRPVEGPGVIELGPDRWIAVALLSGALVGLVFLSLTRKVPTPDELTLSLLGTVLFGAGAGYALGLSPLVVTIIAGAMVANFSAHKRRVLAVLISWERPVYHILLIIVGTLLTLPTGWVVLAVVLFAGWRLTAKYLGGYVALRLLRLGDVPSTMGLALVAQGGLAVVIALNYVVAYRGQPGATVEMVLTTVVALVALNEFLSPSVIRRVLPSAPATAGPLTEGPPRASVPTGDG